MKQAGLVAGLGLLFSYLLSLIPAAGWVFSIVGLVLFLVGVHNISQLLDKEKSSTFSCFP